MSWQIMLDWKIGCGHTVHGSMCHAENNGSYQESKGKSWQCM